MNTSASQTGNELSAASSWLERLIGVGVGGYAAITGAKTAATQAKTELAKANQTGVSTETVRQDQPAGIPMGYVYAGVGLLGVVVIAAALRK